MSIDKLPAELYSLILSHIPRASLQQTVLALTRAAPFAPISQHHLFNSIRLVHFQQVQSLHKRLRSGRLKHVENPEVVPDVALWIQHLSVEMWKLDADVLINLIRLLPNLETFNLWIGADDFSPEHLEDMFMPHMSKLKSLSLKFKPYVRKATYLQFLKGSYFDSTLYALCAWPSSSLSTLSIVQDPGPDPNGIAPRFAQPIVFFRPDHYLSFLVHSQTSLQSLNIRIPGRALAKPNTSLSSDVTATPTFIKFLDLSTSKVSENDVERLLAQFGNLKHLILDACMGLLQSSFRQNPGWELAWWASLGRRCALAGVKKARDREKELKVRYDAAFRMSSATSQDDTVVSTSDEEPRRPRPGRRGLATATISLRGSGLPPRADTSSSVAPATQTSSSNHRNSPLKIHIIPPLPILRSLALYPTSLLSVSPEAQLSIVTEFEKGWNDGIRVFWEKRARIKASFPRETIIGEPKARFLKFRMDVKDRESTQEEGIEDDLEDVSSNEDSIFSRHDNSALDLGSPPVLCLAGPSADEGRHALGCGHSVARHIYDFETSELEVRDYLRPWFSHFPSNT